MRLDSTNWPWTQSIVTSSPREAMAKTTAQSMGSQGRREFRMLVGLTKLRENIGFISQLGIWDLSYWGCSVAQNPALKRYAVKVYFIE